MGNIIIKIYFILFEICKLKEFRYVRFIHNFNKRLRFSRIKKKIFFINKILFKRIRTFLVLIRSSCILNVQLTRKGNLVFKSNSRGLNFKTILFK